jgi:hypothetical protein
MISPYQVAPRAARAREDGGRATSAEAALPVVPRVAIAWVSPVFSKSPDRTLGPVTIARRPAAASAADEQPPAHSTRPPSPGPAPATPLALLDRQRHDRLLRLGLRRRRDRHRTDSDPGRVEGWRAHGRVRWLIHGFRRGPQSGSHGHVSNPRRLKRSMRISRTTLTCTLRGKGYGTYRTGDAFGDDR